MTRDRNISFEDDELEQIIDCLYGTLNHDDQITEWISDQDIKRLITRVTQIQNNIKEKENYYAKK